MRVCTRLADWARVRLAPDGFEALATHGWLGSAMSEPQVAYSVVYHLEIALLFGTLIAIGPLVRTRGAPLSSRQRFGLAEFPG